MTRPICSAKVTWVLAGVCLLGLAGCKEDPAPNAAPAPRTLELSVAQALARPVDRLYSTPGSVTSEERIEVSSRATGYIQRIGVNEGDVISAGDVLVEIDPTEVEGAIRRAEAALSSAQTSLENAETDHARLAGLQQSGAVSTEALRQATVARDLARAGLAEAQAVLDTALAGRKYTTLLSPIDGIVVARRKQVGDMASPGIPILAIESRKRLLFRTSVSESQIANVHVGAAARIEIDALAEIDIPGQILRVIPSGDPVTRRYDVELALPADLDAFPGMFGRAHFVIGSDMVVLVPNLALANRGGLTGVFVVGDDSVARFRWVHRGRVFGPYTEVRAGLEGGETILARDVGRVRDGDLIVAAEAGSGQ